MSEDLESVYSIIIVNYNGGSKLLKCLESVHNFTSNFELFLVDNGSSDGSAVLAVERFPKVRVLQNLQNLGFAKANNLAIRKAKGEWIVLLNPDTIVTANWLDGLVKCANSLAEVGIVTPKLLRMDGRTIDSTGHTFDFRTGYTTDRGAGQVDVGQYDVPQEVPSCCFACAAIRQEVIRTTGLLDEEMVLYFEDVDYSIRARIAGWRVFYCPTSRVFHMRGGLSNRTPSRMQKRAIAYRLRIILKCYDTADAIKFGALRVGRDLLSIAAGIRNNDLPYFLSYLRSPVWNLLNLPLRDRRTVQSTRKVRDEAIFALTSQP